MSGHHRARTCVTSHTVIHYMVFHWVTPRRDNPDAASSSHKIRKRKQKGSIHEARRNNKESLVLLRDAGEQQDNKAVKSLSNNKGEQHQPQQGLTSTMTDKEQGKDRHICNPDNEGYMRDWYGP